ncbi:hypothetical protein [Fructobacillus papyriferae]|nr:hypothetical protein [Fructobacillus papyriferae]
MKNQHSEEPNEEETPYKKPWFILIGIIAVLSMVGYAALLG